MGVRVELGQLAVDAPGAAGEASGVSSANFFSTAPTLVSKADLADTEAVGERPQHGRRVSANSHSARGAQSGVMAVFLVFLFPLVLLGFMLVMGRVEEPLTRVAVEREIEHFLDGANPDELDTFIREGTESALTRFRQRVSLRRLLPTSSRRRSS